MQLQGHSAEKLLSIPRDAADLWVRLSKAACEEVTDRTCRGMEPHLESLWAIEGMFIILCLLFWVCTLPLPFFVSLCYLCNKIPLGIQSKSSGIVQFPLPGSWKSLSCRDKSMGSSQTLRNYRNIHHLPLSYIYIGKNCGKYVCFLLLKKIGFYPAQGVVFI